MQGSTRILNGYSYYLLCIKQLKVKRVLGLAKHTNQAYEQKADPF